MLTVKLVEHAVYQQIRTKRSQKHKINTIKLIHFKLLADLLVERFAVKESVLNKSG